MKKRAPRLVRERDALGAVEIWVEPDDTGVGKVVELLDRDGQVTHITEDGDGSITVRTDGLRTGSHAVRVRADGTAAAIHLD